jgi:putative Holliday junction resolvase
MIDFPSYKRFQLSLNKKILAIDFGSKVIGTAMFCPGRDPFPYIAEKIIHLGIPQSLLALKNLIENESIGIIVLGIPYFLDGKESSNTLAIKSFGEELKKICPAQEFFEQDETLTTKAAEERMKNSPQYNFKVDPTKIDCVAATIILEDFIRS